MKTKKSISKRFKVTRNKKVSRRATSLGHCRANKRTTQMKRRKNSREITLPRKVLAKYL